MEYTYKCLKSLKEVPPEFIPLTIPMSYEVLFIERGMFFIYIAYPVIKSPPVPIPPSPGITRIEEREPHTKIHGLKRVPNLVKKLLPEIRFHIIEIKKISIINALILTPI